MITSLLSGPGSRSISGTAKGARVWWGPRCRTLRSTREAPAKHPSSTHLRECESAGGDSELSRRILNCRHRCRKIVVDEVPIDPVLKCAELAAPQNQPTAEHLACTCYLLSDLSAAKHVRSAPCLVSTSARLAAQGSSAVGAPKSGQDCDVKLAGAQPHPAAFRSSPAPSAPFHVYSSRA